MNKLSPAARERLVFVTLLLVVIAVLIYAPLKYDFIYPTGGDDTAHHITRLQTLTDGIGYLARIAYYGYVVLLPFTLAGMDAVTVFSVFNSLIIIGVFIALWVLTRRYFGFPAAALSFFISVFIVLATWHYFNNGTIFNVLNLWVVNIFAMYALCHWLQTGKQKWLIITGALYIATSLVHSSTFLYIMAAMGLFSAGFGLYQLKKRDYVMLKRIIYFAAVFCLAIVTAWVTWMHRMLPSHVERMTDTITGDHVSYSTVVTWPLFLNSYLNPATLMLLLIAIFMLVIIFKKSQFEEKERIINHLKQPITFIFISFIIVLAIGAFTLLGYNYTRFARDLATFIGLSTAVLLGLALANYRLQYRKAWIVIIAVVLVFGATPILKFTSDYTALRPCDRQAIEFINNFTDELLTVQHYHWVAPWIYRLYSNDNITYQRAYDFSELDDVDIVIFRNIGMTFSTSYWGRRDNILISELAIEHSTPLVEIARFQSGADVVILYKTPNSVLN